MITSMSVISPVPREDEGRVPWQRRQLPAVSTAYSSTPLQETRAWAPGKVHDDPRENLLLLQVRVWDSQSDRGFLFPLVSPFCWEMFSWQETLRNTWIQSKIGRGKTNARIKLNMVFPRTFLILAAMKMGMFLPLCRSKTSAVAEPAVFVRGQKTASPNDWCKHIHKLVPVAWLCRTYLIQCFASQQNEASQIYIATLHLASG